MGYSFVIQSGYYQTGHKVSQLSVGIGVGENKVERDVISLLWN
jgi:hypothetical protein